MATDPTPGAAAEPVTGGPVPSLPTNALDGGPPGGGPPGDGPLVLAFDGDVRGVDWAHTVGLHALTGHPELVVVGLPAPVAAAVVGQLADDVVDGTVLVPGERRRLGDLRLLVAEVDGDVAGGGGWFDAGRALLPAPPAWPPTLQVLWADEDGRFPDGPDDPAWRDRQPVLARDVRRAA